MNLCSINMFTHRHHILAVSDSTNQHIVRSNSKETAWVIRLAVILIYTMLWLFISKSDLYINNYNSTFWIYSTQQAIYRSTNDKPKKWLSHWGICKISIPKFMTLNSQIIHTLKHQRPVTINTITYINFKRNTCYGVLRESTFYTNLQ